MSQAIPVSDWFKLTVLLGIVALVALRLVGMSPSILCGPTLEDVESQIVEEWKRRPPRSESDYRIVEKLVPGSVRITSYKVRPSCYQGDNSLDDDSAKAAYWPIDLTIETDYDPASYFDRIPSFFPMEGNHDVRCYVSRSDNGWTVSFYPPRDKTPWWYFW
jgi:hypothetical protein